jgi:hypothetical protein
MSFYEDLENKIIILSKENENLRTELDFMWYQNRMFFVGLVISYTILITLFVMTEFIL